MTKNDLLFYCLDLPKCFLITLFRAFICTIFFALVNFIDKYAFDATIEIALQSSIEFFINTFFSFLGIFFMMIFLLRLFSRMDFLKKYKDPSHSPFKIHAQWHKLKQ